MLIKLIRPILKDEYNIIVNFKKYYIIKNKRLRKKNEEIIYIRINKLDIVDEALDEFSLDINIRNDQERKLIRSLQKMELIEETFIKKIDVNWEIKAQSY